MKSKEAIKRRDTMATTKTVIIYVAGYAYFAFLLASAVVAVYGMYTDASETALRGFSGIILWFLLGICYGVGTYKRWT